MSQLPSRSRYVLLALVLCFAGGATALAGDQHELDLSHLRLRTDGVQRLAGMWAFWWGRFVDPEADPLPEPDGYIRLPGIWDHWNDEPGAGAHGVGGQGYASYALTVMLPADAGELSLFVPPASTAYRLYVDGALVARSGSPGRSADRSIPRYRIRTVRLRPQGGVIDLVAHVSNFHHRRGGLWRPIVIGTPEDVEAWTTLELVYDLLLAGGLLLMALFLLGLYASGPRDLTTTAPLFAAMFFLALAARIMVTGQMVATRVFTEISWATQLRVEYVAAHAALVSFVWLFHAAYPRRIPRWLVAPVSVYAGANAAVALLFPLLVYSRWVPLYALSMNAVFVTVAVVLAVAALEREPGALTYLAGALLAVLSAAGEALQVSPLLASREMIPLSFLVRLIAGDVLRESTVQAVSVGGSLALVFAAAAVIVLRTSRTLIAKLTNAGARAPRPGLVELREAAEHARNRLTADFHVTAREFEIAGLVAQGLGNAEIADRLCVSVPTVKKHLYNLMHKIGVKNRHELTMLYLRHLQEDSEIGNFIPK